MHLRDKGGKPIEQGLYKRGPVEDPEYLNVYDNGHGFIADGHKRYEVSRPKGLPDSSIMPPGEI